MNRNGRLTWNNRDDKPVTDPSVSPSVSNDSELTTEDWQARWKEAADRADARDDASYRWKMVARRLVSRSNGFRDDTVYLGKLLRKAEQDRDTQRSNVLIAEAGQDHAIRTREEWREAAEAMKAELDDLRTQLAAQEPAVIEKTLTVTADDLPDVTRVVVVGPGGMNFERRDLYESGARIEIQDNGRTLKVFPIEPQRTEGAEDLSSELEAVLAHLGIGGACVSPEKRDEAADLLAERGVRVTSGAS